MFSAEIEEILLQSMMSLIPYIREVIYNDPVTVINWTDGVKTVVRCQPGDVYNEKVGFLMCFMKRVCGNTGRYNNLLREFVPGYGIIDEPKAEPELIVVIEDPETVVETPTPAIEIIEEPKANIEIESPVEHTAIKEYAEKIETAENSQIVSSDPVLNEFIEVSKPEEQIKEPIREEIFYEDEEDYPFLKEEPKAFEEPQIIEEPKVFEEPVEEPRLEEPKPVEKAEEPVVIKDDSEKEYIAANERSRLFVFQSV